MSMTKQGLLLAIIPACALIPSPAAADVKSGVDAWSRGDFSAAVKEWEGPAATGDVEAQFNLGQAYRLGKGVDTDLGKAESLFAKAASHGLIQASDNYGLLLFDRGQRVQALPYLRASASRGDARAQYLLAISRFNGDYETKDWVRAYALMTLAHQAGLAPATAALAQMEMYLSPEQRRMGASLAPQIASEAQANRDRQFAAAGYVDSSNLVTAVAGDTATPDRPAKVDSRTRPLKQAPARQHIATNQSLEALPKTTSAKAKVAITPPGAGVWRVQLGAFSVAANADAQWDRVKGMSEISGHPRLNVPSGRLIKLQAGGYTRESANAACAKLAKAGQTCLPVTD
jgi:cell division septation protein DedD